MQFTTLTILATALGLVAAQTSTTSSVAAGTSVCAAQAVLNVCVSQQSALNSRCGGNDYDCLCAGYTALTVCYNNCPNDPNAFSASQNKVQYCQAASLYGSSAMSRQSQSQSATASISGPLSSALSSASSSASAASSSVASVQSSASRSASSAASSASAAATKTGAAASMAMPAAGVLGMVLGAAALL
ncbi:hypothetical protein E4T44_10143 [Aureobasidium sp. EXF-8845]|nr:hypothetical protein E4T44_10143 [Aureobasidium sp. EXF-8845]KAI4835319.1 hypothetical protein E4T45_09987 [Aureobasidium sp. EXF-8846]